MSSRPTSATQELRVQRQRMVSVGTKLALGTFCLVALVSASIYFGLTAHERNGQIAAKRRSVGMVLELVAQALSAPVVFGDDAGIAETLGYLRQNPDVVQAGVWRVDATGQPNGKLGELMREAKAALLPRPRAEQAGTLDVRSQHVDAVNWVKDAEGQRVALVAVRFSLASENQAFEVLSRSILQVSVGVAVALTLLLLLLARVYIVRPLGKLYVAVQRFENGELVALPKASNDEVGHLAHAFGRMAAAIDKRERAIARKNDEMRLVLDNVGQGFLVLGADGTTHGQHSAIIERWFGKVREGEAIWSYLAPHDPTNAEWLELTWSNLGVLFMPIEVCIEQFPKRFTADGRCFDLEFRPLLRPDEKLDKMVLVISDVTDLVAREKAEREQRELVAIFNRVVKDRTGFLGFYEDAASTVRRIAGERPGDERDVLRDVHTLKSNASLYGVESVARLCDEIESRVAEEVRPINRSERESVAKAWQHIATTIQRYLGTDRDGRVEIEQSDYDGLVRAIDAREPHARLAERLMEIGAEPAERALRRLAERLEVLARRLGKCEVQVNVVGNEVRLPRDRLAPLWAALSHVVRNTVDHGLETTQERLDAEKPMPARVEMLAEMRGDLLVIRISDDGRGVDWEVVRERARRRGLAHHDRADLIDALFSDGFSTLSSVSEVSGRGIGLSAVRATVDKLGGRLTLDSERGRGTRLTLEIPGSVLRSTAPPIKAKAAND